MGQVHKRDQSVLLGESELGPRRRTVLRAMGVGAAAGLFSVDSAFAGTRPFDEADLILFNGRIVRHPLSDGLARAVAIKGSRIIAVGHTGEVMRHSSPRTQKVNLRGKTVIPGLNDTHYHQTRAAGNRLYVSLLEARSIADVAQAIANRIAETPSGEWVQASSLWHEGQLQEKRLPTRHDLDPVSPNNPVYIPRGGHTITVNSRALEIAGITEDTPDPENGLIVRDENGVPTGVMFDAATHLVEQHLPPPPSGEEFRRLLEARMQDDLSVGITSLTNPGVGFDAIELYRDMSANGDLPVRVHLLYRFGTLDDVQTALSTYDQGSLGPHLSLDGFKYGIDGGVETAFLEEPYEIVPGFQEDPDYRGLLILPPGGLPELRESLETAARAGWQVQTHAVGDAAIRVVMDLYREVNDVRSVGDLRWALVHAFLPSDDDMRTARELRVPVTVQDHPVLLGTALETWWGQERAAYTTPLRSMVDHGLLLAGGSDMPVVPLDPFLSMWWMVTRGTLVTGVLGPEQGIDRRQALNAYTTGSAYTQFADKELGTITEGKLADMVVLSDDILTVPASDIHDIKADMTIVDGEIVYER